MRGELDEIWGLLADRAFVLPDVVDGEVLNDLNIADRDIRLNDLVFSCEHLEQVTKLILWQVWDQHDRVNFRCKLQVNVRSEFCEVERLTELPHIDIEECLDEINNPDAHFVVSQQSIRTANDLECSLQFRDGTSAEHQLEDARVHDDRI